MLVLVGSAVVASAQGSRAEHLVWSDEFNGEHSVPDPANWKFETGGNGWGNHELETYCAPGSDVAPCKAATPNVVVTDGYLHLVARRDAATGKWTSARMTTKGLQSFQYGRMQYYVDDPAHPYATYTRADLPKGAVWPFDDGRYFFVLNLAMGGDWPGPPAATTPATVEMLVDYVRVYQDEQLSMTSAGAGKR